MKLKKGMVVKLRNSTVGTLLLVQEKQKTEEGLKVTVFSPTIGEKVWKYKNKKEFFTKFEVVSGSTFFRDLFDKEIACVVKKFRGIARIK